MEKFEIPFLGKPLLEWSLMSLINFRAYEFIFIARRTPGVHDLITKKCKELGFNRMHIRVLEAPTRGQAETALYADEFFDDDDSVIIFNIDTHIQPDYLRPELIHGNGWIPVFSAQGNRWSFVETIGDEVVRTEEKVRISDKCSIGLYYFDSFCKFKEIVMRRGSSGIVGEWYIAPLYNDFIKAGNRVYAHQIPSESVLVLGTPEDIAEAGKKYMEPRDYAANHGRVD